MTEQSGGARTGRGAVPVIPGRVGIIGGTFDPIHMGHLAIAEAASEELGLERVLFVPARLPPHRSIAPEAMAGERAEMVELAIAGNPMFALSLVELERDGPSYTADTIDELAAAERTAGRTPDFWFILSAEAFAGVLTWNDPARLLTSARIVVLPREGHPPPDLRPLALALPGLAHRVSVLEGPRIRLSATEIRARAGRGLSVRYLVPDAVAAYIVKRRLYRSTDPTAPRTAVPATKGTLRP